MQRQSLTAPFPYTGGKRKIASEVWKRFGQADVYIEPFAGSLAVLLGCPSPGRREIVCDLDGLICNFWRALIQDPIAVARWADYPTIHQDLTARHKWLVSWRASVRDRLSEDPEFCDPRAAGWWCWGISNWIGGGWCTDTPPDWVPCTVTKTGQGVQSGRTKVPDSHPGNVGVSRAGGVQQQRVEVPDFRPGSCRYDTSQGVQSNRVTLPVEGSGVSRLEPWFRALAARLKRVIVINRDWKSAVTPTMMSATKHSPRGLNRCVFLDPPYLTALRSTGLYAARSNANEVAKESYEWAVAHGSKYRIAYCCHTGDFPVPEGWDSTETSFMGSRKGNRDLVMYSPACKPKAGFGFV